MKSSKEMRDFLIEQMGEVASGTQAVTTAKGICNYAQQVYNTMNIELKYAMAKEKLGDNEILPIEF